MSNGGDLVDDDNEEEVDDLEENAEPLIMYYQPPFYYPICVPMILAQRYRIEHKLGHGGFSTVWMAYDIVAKQDVAVKVTTLARYAVDPESAMHAEIRRRVQDTSKLLLSHETFSLAGHDGHHMGLVFPLKGPSLHTCFASMSMPDRMSAAKQVLQALKCLHDANIVHTDLSDKNVMCGMVSLDGYDIKAKYELLGRPKKMLLQAPVGLPGELVRPVLVPCNLLTKSVYLGDFGSAITAGTSINYKPQSPGAWCAPERFHNTDPSTASDMWSYMCLFTELYLGTLPWSIYGESLAGNVEVLGPLPQTWYAHHYLPARANASWYDPRRRPETTLEAMIARSRPDISLTDRAHVLSFLLRGFSYDAQNRITATQLLDDASFQAVMRVYGV